MGADDYEKKFMEGEGESLYREKFRNPWWLNAAMLGGPVAGAVSLALTVGSPLGALFAATGIGVWLLFRVLRLIVTEQYLHIQYGLWGPRIAISSIREIDVVDYKPLQYGGWGIRHGPGGERVYNMLGDKGRAVRIVYLDETGKERVVLVSSAAPESVVAAVERARSAGGLAAARVAQGVLDAPVVDDNNASKSVREDQSIQSELDQAHRRR